jgi:hypothetical protein
MRLDQSGASRGRTQTVSQPHNFLSAQFISVGGEIHSCNFPPGRGAAGMAEQGLCVVCRRAVAGGALPLMIRFLENQVEAIRFSALPFLEPDRGGHLA